MTNYSNAVIINIFSVSVGYEYETCPSLILWEKRTALLQGFELDPSNLGGWSLDKHHVLNIKSGKLKDFHCCFNFKLVPIFPVASRILDNDWHLTNTTYKGSWLCTGTELYVHWLLMYYSECLKQIQSSVHALGLYSKAYDTCGCKSPETAVNFLGKTWE